MMGPKVNISGNTQPGSKKYKNPRTKNAKKNKKNKQLAMQGNSQVCKNNLPYSKQFINHIVYIVYV